MSRLLRALVAIAAIAASVGSGRSAAATTPERRLVVVADSVPLGAAPAIRAAFTGWDVAIEGRQVVVTATAVDPGGPGYLTAYPCGAAPPTASALNYEAGQVVANLAVVAVGAGGQVCVTSHAAADVVLDLAGWSPPTGTEVPAGPTRLADTRPP